MSTARNLAPCLASLMVEFIKSFVSSILVVGEPVSSGQESRSPPTVIRTRCVYLFSDLTSQTKVAYVTSLPGGTFAREMNRIVFVPTTPYSLPLASLPHSFDKLLPQIFSSFPLSRKSIESLSRHFLLYVALTTKITNLTGFHCSTY